MVQLLALPLGDGGGGTKCKDDDHSPKYFQDLGAHIVIRARGCVHEAAHQSERVGGRRGGGGNESAVRVGVIRRFVSNM